MTGPSRAVLVPEQRGRDALGVAAVAQLAVELVDEVAAVGEDQDAAGARGLDEAERGDRLAGAGGVLEPEALAGVRVLGLLGELRRRRRPSRLVPVLRLVGLVLVLELLLAGDARRARARRSSSAIGAVAVAVAVALRLGEQRGQRARQRVDLVGGEHGAVDQRRLVLAQQPLEAEQQRELPPPLDRRARRPASISASAASSARAARACRARARSRRPPPRRRRARA